MHGFCRRLLTAHCMQHAFHSSFSPHAGKLAFAMAIKTKIPLIITERSWVSSNTGGDCSWTSVDSHKQIDLARHDIKTAKQREAYLLKNREETVLQMRDYTITSNVSKNQWDQIHHAALQISIDSVTRARSILSQGQDSVTRARSITLEFAEFTPGLAIRQGGNMRAVKFSCSKQLARRVLGQSWSRYFHQILALRSRSKA